MPLRIEQRLERDQVELAIGRDDEVGDARQPAADRCEELCIEVAERAPGGLWRGVLAHGGEHVVDRGVDQCGLAERNPLWQTLPGQEVGEVARLLPGLLCLSSIVAA